MNPSWPFGETTQAGDVADKPLNGDVAIPNHALELVGTLSRNIAGRADRARHRQGAAACGHPSRALVRKQRPSVMVGYAVGISIAPGTYSAPGSGFCYWEQDSDFLDQFGSIISNGPSAVR
jgi:hypothetical protein